MTDQAQRATDHSAHSDFSVEKLIAAEDDEKQRTFLLILFSMNKALNENTALTRLIAKQTETYIKEYDAMMAQSRIWVIVGRATWFLIAAIAVWSYGLGKEWATDTGGRLGTLEMRVQKIEDVNSAVKLFEGVRE